MFLCENLRFYKSLLLASNKYSIMCGYVQYFLREKKKVEAEVGTEENETNSFYNNTILEFIRTWHFWN